MLLSLEAKDALLLVAKLVELLKVALQPVSVALKGQLVACVRVLEHCNSLLAQQSTDLNSIVFLPHHVHLCLELRLAGVVFRDEVVLPFNLLVGSCLKVNVQLVHLLFQHFQLLTLSGLLEVQV